MSSYYGAVAQVSLHQRHLGLPMHMGACSICKDVGFKWFVSSSIRMNARTQRVPSIRFQLMIAFFTFKCCG